MSNEPEKNANSMPAGNAPGAAPAAAKTAPSRSAEPPKPAAPEPEPKTPETEKKKAVPDGEKNGEPLNLSLNIDNRPEISGTGGSVDNTAFKLEMRSARDIFIGTDGAVRITQFSKSMRARLTRSTEEAEAVRHIHDELTTSQFISILQESRILIISAEPNSGKSSTAIYLAHRLRLCDPELKEEITQVFPLDAAVQINLAEAVQQEESFCRCVIFFKDFLTGQNRALREFLEGLDQRLADSLCRELKARGSYLIFTTDDHFIESISSQLQALRLCIPLPRLGSAKLSEALNSILKEIQIDVTLTQEQRDQVLLYGKTVPRIRRFVREYLSIVVEGKSTVERAFSRMDQVSLWLKYLAADFEAWNVAFVLGLVQPVSGPQGVPWTEFQELYSALLKPIHKWTGTPEKYFVYRPERLCDDELLTKARVTIKPSADGRDMVQFQDQAFLEALWPAFLHQTRRLMTSLLPILRQLAQEENLSLRIHAARILGRIGEMDPAAIILPLISEWTHANSVRWRQATVGYLFQGIMHSTNETYMSNCLADLERMGQSDDTDEIWTAIAALKQIGILDLPLAMARLKNIAEAKLAVYLSHNDEILRIMQNIEREFKKPNHTRKEAFQLIAAHEFLKELGFALLRHHGPVFFAMQYSLVALCLAKGPIEVFTELRKWLRGNEGLRSLVCLLYLQSDGIADELSGFIMTKEEMVAEKREDAKADSAERKETRSAKKHARANPILTALSQSPDSPVRFAQFLEDIFANFNTVFRMGRTNYLREAFFNHLRSCVVESGEFPRGRKALEDVFVRLLTSPLVELKMQTMDMFQTNIFLQKGSREEEFAISVKRKSLFGGRNNAKNALAIAKM
ncbi:MAG: hypothetical protein LAO76_26950 [Acidobacteriia bacterium]|nr:hypothetical protein [Terriglobia bacterium]